MDYIIGIDTGTTNTKAVAISTDGKLIAEASRSASFIEAQSPGVREQDPQQLFEAFLDVLTEVRAKTIQHNLLAIGLSTGMHSLMAVDAMGRPLTNLITWADLRSETYANELRNSDIGDQIFQCSGVPMHPMLPLTKIRWLKDHCPEIFLSTHKFIGIKEYFIYQLFGEYSIDFSLASATGLFDLNDKIWNKQALAYAGITEDKLSVPKPGVNAVSGLFQAMALRLNIARSTPFILGASDGCLANLGSGASSEQDMTLTIGTSGAIRMTTRSSAIDAAQKTFTYILSEDLFVSGGPINNGTVLLNWFSANFLKKPFRSLEDLHIFMRSVENIPSGAEGLVFLPYINGERAPVWDATAKGAFIGLQPHHQIEHMMRALIEGICYSLRDLYNSVLHKNGAARHIYVSGGFIHSHEWVQILCDILKRPLRIAVTSDASAFGAALYGLHALGYIENLTEIDKRFFPAFREYFPRTEYAAIYDRNFQVYQPLYKNLQAGFRLL